MKNRFGFFVVALFALALASCIEPYGANGYEYQNNNSSQNGSTPTSNPRPRPRPANIQWVFHPSDPMLFVMKIVVNGNLQVVDRKTVEYFDNQPASPGTQGIPRSAISGYFVDGADGEWTTYYAMREGNSIGVYRQDANPYGSQPRARRVASISL